MNGYGRDGDGGGSGGFHAHADDVNGYTPPRVHADDVSRPLQKHARANTHATHAHPTPCQQLPLRHHQQER